MNDLTDLSSLLFQSQNFDGGMRGSKIESENGSDIRRSIEELVGQ